jgi:hypothetical protein
MAVAVAQPTPAIDAKSRAPFQLVMDEEEEEFLLQLTDERPVVNSFMEPSSLSP